MQVRENRRDRFREGEERSSAPRGQITKFDSQREKVLPGNIFTAHVKKSGRGFARTSDGVFSLSCVWRLWRCVAAVEELQPASRGRAIDSHYTCCPPRDTVNFPPV